MIFPIKKCCVISFLFTCIFASVMAHSILTPCIKLLFLNLLDIRITIHLNFVGFQAYLEPFCFTRNTWDPVYIVYQSLGHSIASGNTNIWYCSMNDVVNNLCEVKSNKIEWFSSIMFDLFDNQTHEENRGWFYSIAEIQYYWTITCNWIW